MFYQAPLHRCGRDDSRRDIRSARADICHCDLSALSLLDERATSWRAAARERERERERERDVPGIDPRSILSQTQLWGEQIEAAHPHTDVMIYSAVKGRYTCRSSLVLVCNWRWYQRYGHCLLTDHIQVLFTRICNKLNCVPRPFRRDQKLAEKHYVHQTQVRACTHAATVCKCFSLWQQIILWWGELLTSDSY